VLDDVVGWHGQHPSDWRATWSLLESKYGDDDRCPRGRGWLGSQYTGDTSFNIDAKLNGAYVFLGLLYGGGDFTQSLLVTMQCGQDTDSNCQNLGAILGSYLGFEDLPDQSRPASIGAFSSRIRVSGSVMHWMPASSWPENSCRGTAAAWRSLVARRPGIFPADRGSHPPLPRPSPSAMP
jgi:hypothetical protein